VRRSAPSIALALALAAAIAGCGGGDTGDEAATTATARRTVTTPAVPPLTRVDAVREVQSAVSQEAFQRDFSFAAQDVRAGCAPLDDGDPATPTRFACRYTTPKDACKGEAQVTRAPDGSNRTSRLTMKCTGPPNIGPDTS
jgi:hypothetical protein